MSNEIYLTRACYEKFCDELEQLKKDSLRIADQINEARQLGDLKENAEYHAAKEAQAYNAARQGDLKNKISMARIIEDQNIPGDKIYIGAIVTLKDLETGEKMKYQMVSPEESNFEENKVSIFAPIGKGLMGKPEGAEMDIDVPAGKLRYKVLKIERPK
ncbi:MAG: transcription elongation factor GreA [Candidatus Omnitrophica bacterium]|nr:transcription elongation factor GreA [Candidatus Omnitrophota bacterium]